MKIDLQQIKNRSPSASASEAASLKFAERCRSEREEFVVDVGPNGSMRDLPMGWGERAERIVAGSKVLKDRNGA